MNQINGLVKSLDLLCEWAIISDTVHISVILDAIKVDCITFKVSVYAKPSIKFYEIPTIKLFIIHTIHSKSNKQIIASII